MPKSVLILILVITAFSSIIVFAVVGPRDRILQPTNRSIQAFHPETHRSQQQDIESPERCDAIAKAQNRITHAEFVSIIFPALGLDSRTLRTATVEDRIDILEDLGFAPADGYQPDKTLTVKEASIVLAETAARLGRRVTSKSEVRRDSQSTKAVVPKHVKPVQIARSVEHLGSAFSGANDQPVSADELAAAIQPGTTQQRTSEVRRDSQSTKVDVEARATTTVTVETQTVLGITIQADEFEGLRRLLEEKLVEYYHPRYVQPLSLTD